MRRIGLMTGAAAALVVVAGCAEESGGPDPCAEVDCGEHGRCVAEGDEPSCRCDPGFRPEETSCVPDGADGDADADTDGATDADSSTSIDGGGGDGTTDAGDDGDDDAGHDGGAADGGSDGATDAGDDDRLPLIWHMTIVASGGRLPSIDVDDDGNVGVAHFAQDSVDDGICDAIEGDPARTRVPLSYSWKVEGSEAWDTELLYDPIHVSGQPEGVSFRFAPDGTPAAAVFGGDPVGLLCSSNDLLLGRRDAETGWAFETAAASSGEAPVPAGDDCSEAVSTAGSVVGAWPALAFDGSGEPAIAYRDVHFGGMQADDVRRADAELALHDDGWEQLMVDCGHGGGHQNALALDSEGRLVAAFAVTVSSVESRYGLWVARREADGSWSRIRLASGPVELRESSLAAGAGGTVAVAYHDPSAGTLSVAELSDPSRFDEDAAWEITAITDPGYRSGSSPSLAYAPSGRLSAAYYRCGLTGAEVCSPTESGLVYARRSSAGSWARIVVDGGEGVPCGVDAAMALDSSGQPWIAYSCEREGAEVELKVATPI